MNNKHDLHNWETFSPTNYPAIPLDADVKYGARLLAGKAKYTIRQTSHQNADGTFLHKSLKYYFQPQLLTL